MKIRDYITQKMFPFWKPKIELQLSKQVQLKLIEGKLLTTLYFN